MPATEQTWRDQKLMHRIFAVSGIIMLGATIWMFLADHAREWKVYQRNFRDVELTLMGWRGNQFQSDKAQRQHAELSAKLLEAQSQAIDPKLLGAFQEEVNEDASNRSESPYNFNSIDRIASELEELATQARNLRRGGPDSANNLRDDAELADIKATSAQAEAQQARLAISTAADKGKAQEEYNKKQQKADELVEKGKTLRVSAQEANERATQAELKAKAKRDQLIDKLETITKAARFREDYGLRSRKFKSADVDAAKANIGLAVRDGLPTEELQEKVDELVKGQGGLDELSRTYEEASAHRKELQRILNQMSKGVWKAEEELDDNQAELNRISTSKVKRRSTYFVSSPPFLGKKWLELPILDAFSSPLRIDNLWDEDNKIDYNFSKVRRFDRCTTCHQAIQKTRPGSAVDPAFVKEREIALILKTPTENELPESPTLENVYGIQLAETGEYLLDADDAMVSFVQTFARDAAPAKLRVSAGAFPLKAELEIKIRGGNTGAPAAAGESNGGKTVKLSKGDDSDKVAAAINEVGSTLGIQAAAADGEVEISTLEVGAKYFLGIELVEEGQGGEFEANLDSTVATGVDGSSSLGAQAILAPDTDDAKLVVGEVLRKQALEPYFSDKDNEQTPGLMVGDAIVRVNDDIVRDGKHAQRLLLSGRKKSDWGEPLRLTIRRGLPNPYTSHPRLDLFVGSLSPHKMSVFACTICHEGQGSATAFKWASHAPNDAEQLHDWAHDHGWFDNHHWIFPMYPKRFAESSCLKCHHDVTELEPSKRFPDPPAPKLMHGYNLVRKYGCYGCHEINGWNGPDESVGPDLRLEPEYFAAAQQFKYAASTGFDTLNDEQKGWVDQLIMHPERDAVRHEIEKLILQDAQSDHPRFSGEVLNTLGPLFKDVETPGKLRKPGPALRFVKDKLNEDFLYDWIREPKGFRPTTRMPQFFGLWNHLEGESESTARQYEPVEILGIVSYLQQYSQPFNYIDPPQGISQSMHDEQVERGKVQFQQRGCLACHCHDVFEDAKAFRYKGEIVQGPDLSGVAAKFDNEKGRKWLYSWLKNPSNYNVRTLMPDLKLEPIQHKDADGNVIMTTDPAADIVEFLMADSKSEWKPAGNNLTKVKLQNDVQVKATLDEMVLENLQEGFSERAAKRYLEEGIPEDMRGELKGAEVELVGRSGIDERLLYIGRKAIGKYGCYGCHDIPGFEAAKPIGTGLADWGRKDPSKLAFNHIANYLHGHAHGTHDEEQHEGHDQEHADDAKKQGEFDSRDLGFYLHSLEAGHRAGFIYQKLREPRSYDYHEVENKKYNERLRMPQFPLDDEEREAVVTFVLGLLADPPAAKFVYQPDERQRAIMEGKQVLAKYNCRGCHMLSYDQWEVAFKPGGFAAPDPPITFPFLTPKFSDSVLAASATPDRQGLLQSHLSVLPTISAQTGLPEVEGIFEGEYEPLEPDGEYDPSTLKYYVDLYEPAAVDGKVWWVFTSPALIPSDAIETRRSSDGGFLTKYLFSYVVKREPKINPNKKGKGKEAWAWLPPPLVGEGKKVQTDWLHDFLLDPYPIRPAVVLRMPKFNMSSEEATKLVNYFAAVDNVDYPYEFSNRRRSDHLNDVEEKYEKLVQETGSGDTSGMNRFEAGLNIVTSGDGCVKCHKVNDFEPKGFESDKAPNLAEVYRRLRPDYVRRWIARPAQILPYTAMPENIKYNPEDKEFLGGVKQELYHGTSIEQLDGLVDLLMNFDKYSVEQNKVADKVKIVPTEGEAAGAESESE